MKLGTFVRLPDGRVGTVVFSGLVGVGIKWGWHYPNPKDFEGTHGDLFTVEVPPELRQWMPDALLRNPWKGCERSGWTKEQCVGTEYKIVKDE